jgi:hypothetical protein
MAVWPILSRRTGNSLPPCQSVSGKRHFVRIGPKTMTNLLKRYAAAFFATLAVSFSASAVTIGPDYTDQWWNPAESGWGVNFIEQGDVIFATLFVYGADNTARWYVASMRPSGSAFSGALSQTTGPYFGNATFNPASVGVTTVGAMTVAFANQYSGTLTYSVNGVNVTKSIVRQTFGEQNIAGKYLGGLTAQGTNCRNTPNGPILIFDTMTVTQAGRNVSMLVQFTSTTQASSQCTFAGTLTAQGRVGQITNGTWNCVFGGSPGNQGTFSMDVLDASQQGFSARFSGTDQFCSYNGFFGGVKDVI